MDEEDLKRKREDYWHFRRYAGPESLRNPATWSNATLGAVFGILSSSGGAYLYGRWYKRPWYSALPYKFMLISGVSAFGYLAGKFRDYHMSTRDAVVEHYMQLHPEDFEHLQDSRGGRKLKDLFLPWSPVRVQERIPTKPDI